jgi:hypothetical protein
MAMLEERLYRFRLNAVLLGIKRISALLKTWQNEPDYETDRMLARKFCPHTIRTLRLSSPSAQMALLSPA